MDNNGWVDETLPLRMLHSMRDGMWRSRRNQGANVSPIAEVPVLPHAAFAAATPPPEAPRTVEPTVEALPALTIAEVPVVETPEAPVFVAEDQPELGTSRQPVIRSLEAARHRRAVSSRLTGRRAVASAGAFGIALTAVLGSSVGVAAAAAPKAPKGGAGTTAVTGGGATATATASATKAKAQGNCDSSGSAEASLGDVSPPPSYNLTTSPIHDPNAALVNEGDPLSLTYFDEAGFTATGTVTGPWPGPPAATLFPDTSNVIAGFTVSPTTSKGSNAGIPIKATVPQVSSHGPGFYAVTISTADDDDKIPLPCKVQWLLNVPAPNPPQLAGDIFLCQNGSASTDRPTTTGSITSSGPGSTHPSGGNSTGAAQVVTAGSPWSVSANAPSGYHFVACSNQPSGTPSVVLPSGSAPTTAQTSTFSLATGNNVDARFYVVPNPPNTQTLAADVFQCQNGQPTRVGVTGATLNTAGPGTQPSGGTSIPATNVTASPNWVVTATLPTGWKMLPGCPGDTFPAGTVTSANVLSNQSANETVNVPSSGSGAAVFYAAPATSANISLTKTADASTVTAGNSFNWTLVARNSGSGDATHAVVTDPVPNGLTINGTPSTTQGSCSVSGQNVTCNLGTLAASSSATIVINVTASGTVCGPILNTGTLTTDQGTTQGSATVTVNCPNFNINLTKSASVGNNATITAGTSFTYTLVATNTGGAAATGVVVTDAIPSQLTINGTPTSTQGTCSVSGNNVSCNVGTLAANNGSATITINVGTSTSSCGVVNNMGQVTASGGTTGNSNTVTTTIVCAETVGITVGVVKTNNAQDPTGTSFGKTETAQTLGETFNYQAVITNTSTVTEVIGTITDSIAGQPIQDVCASLVGQTLAPQASVTCTFQGVAPNTNGASLTDTVTVPVSQQGTPTNTGTGTDTSTVNTPPGVVITKASNAAGTGFGQNETVAPGSTSVPYQVTVTNPNSSPGTITSLTDTIGGTTTNICPNLIGTVLAPSGQPNDSVVCNFTTSVPSSVTTDTAAVNLSVNGVVVPGSAQTTVFPPVLGTVITPATPAPATLAFTGAPIGKLLASALGMIAMGLLLLFGLQVIDTRRRPGLRFAVAERGRRAGPVPPVPTREPSIWKGGNGYEQTATAAAATWLADRIRSGFVHLRR